MERRKIEQLKLDRERDELRRDGGNEGSVLETDTTKLTRKKWRRVKREGRKRDNEEVLTN